MTTKTKLHSAVCNILDQLSDNHKIADYIVRTTGKALIPVYAYFQYTGPGLSHAVRSFTEPGPYVQTHSVLVAIYAVPFYFARSVEGACDSNTNALLQKLDELSATCEAHLVMQGTL